MAELNLKQIIDRLNAEFTGETRKLVFWYDDKAEFAEDMETVELQNAKIYHLQPDNQFYSANEGCRRACTVPVLQPLGAQHLFVALMQQLDSFHIGPGFGIGRDPPLCWASAACPSRSLAAGREAAVTRRRSTPCRVARPG